MRTRGLERRYDNSLYPSMKSPSITPQIEEGERRNREKKKGKGVNREITTEERPEGQGVWGGNVNAWESGGTSRGTVTRIDLTNPNGPVQFLRLSKSGRLGWRAKV